MKNLIIISLFFISITNVNAQITFKRESKESMVKYLEDKGVQFDAEDIATLHDLNVFKQYYTNQMLSVPEAYFFNKDGYRVSKELRGDSCGQSIKNAKKINKIAFDDKQIFWDWIKTYSFPFMKENDSTNYDAYVIITWAVFAHTNSNETAFKWYKSLKENKDMKVKVLLLNIDVQTDWQISDENAKILGLQ